MVIGWDGRGFCFRIFWCGLRLFWFGEFCGEVVGCVSGDGFGVTVVACYGCWFRWCG